MGTWLGKGFYRAFEIGFLFLRRGDRYVFYFFLFEKKVRDGERDGDVVMRV